MNENVFNRVLIVLVIALSIGLVSAYSNHTKGENDGYAECRQ